MPKKGENIYKRKDGRWEGRFIKYYTPEGKAKYGYVYARTYTAAKKLLLEKQIAHKNSNPEITTQTICYNQVLNEWMQHIHLQVKESTYSRYFHLVRNHIKPILGIYQLNKINSQLIESYVEQLLNNGRLDGTGGLSPKTVSDIIAIIKSSMEYARYHNYNITCDLSRLSIKKNFHKIRVLSLQEQSDLTAILEYNTDFCKLGVLLSLYTGIRLGELCALRWENIDAVQCILKIRKTLLRIQNTDTGENAAKTKIIITEPKSQYSIRDIPLPAFLSEILSHYHQLSEAYVLTGKADKYLEPRTVQNRFKSYIRDANLPDANFHSLRHTFATRCVELGFDVKSLSEILGHASVNITLNRYVHSSFGLKKDNMEKLSLIAKL